MKAQETVPSQHPSYPAVGQAQNIAQTGFLTQGPPSYQIIQGAMPMPQPYHQPSGSPFPGHGIPHQYQQYTRPAGAGPVIPNVLQQPGHPALQDGLPLPGPNQAESLHGKTSPLPVPAPSGPPAMSEPNPPPARTEQIALADTTLAAQSTAVSSPQTNQVIIDKNMLFFRKKNYQH